MNRSTPLSPDARRLLELGSHVEPPTTEQNDRMDRALATLFRAGRAPAGGAGSALGSVEPGSIPEKSAIHRRPLPPPSRRSLESLFGLNASKLWLALGALAATASASFWLGRVSTPSIEVRDEATVVESVSASAVSSTAGPSSAVSPSSRLAVPMLPAPSLRATLVPPPSPEMTPHTLATGADVLPASAAQRAEGRPSPQANAPAIYASAPTHDAIAVHKPRARASERPKARDPLGLAAELEQLAGAEAALRQGRAERALLLLEQRSVHHLLEQAAALRAIAECDLGTVSGADGARSVLARWPGSAFQTRITRACGL
ncbi:MAG TPA: hypothetical protein VMG12_17080 [Polyangiaceae bacterium]|nr:hypothetical protein [Polyangiaceae bacterium]